MRICQRRFIVNLSLNRKTKWVEVLSYRPYQGKVMVRIHDAPVVPIRIPDWVNRQKVNVKINGVDHDVEWRRSYVRINNLCGGDEVVVTYSLRRITVREKILSFKNEEFSVTWRGDIVIDIKLPRQNYPLYQRSNLDSDSVPMKEIKLYSPLKEIRW